MLEVGEPAGGARRDGDLMGDGWMAMGSRARRRVYRNPPRARRCARTATGGKEGVFRIQTGSEFRVQSSEFRRRGGRKAD